MKTVVLLSCLMAAAWSAPSTTVNPLRELPALRHEEVHDEWGQYAFRYITADNTVVSERGWMVPAINDTYVLAVEGQYEYIGDDNLLYVTRYHGGLDGFHVDSNNAPELVV